MVKWFPFFKSKTEVKKTRIEKAKEIASIPVENFPTVDPKIARRYPDPLLPVSGIAGRRHDHAGTC